MEEIKEAEIVKNKELIKPVFKNEIRAEIKTIGSIEDNIQEVQEYALKLNEYYSKIVFTEETSKEATDEKAEVNKFKDKVKKFKKEIVDEYNKPINNFKELCDTTITLLEDTYKTINNQVKAFDEKTIAEYTEIIRSYFDEYAESKKIDFVKFEDMNFKVLKGSVTENKNLTKKTKETIEKFINKIVDDITLINSQQYVDEMMIEYKKDLNVSKAITEVNNRHIELEKAQQEKEAKKEQKLTDEVMLNKIESLSAPKIEEKEVLPLLEGTFKVVTPFKECLKEIVEVTKKYDGTKIINLTKNGDVYHE